MSDGFDGGNIKSLANAKLNRNGEDQTDDVPEPDATNEFDAAKVKEAKKHGNNHANENDGNCKCQGSAESAAPLSLPPFDAIVNLC